MQAAGPAILSSGRGGWGAGAGSDHCGGNSDGGGGGGGGGDGGLGMSGGLGGGGDLPEEVYALRAALMRAEARAAAAERARTAAEDDLAALQACGGAWRRLLRQRRMH